MKTLTAIKKQQGFLIPVAMFIIIVMAIFAAALSRTTTQTSISFVQELVSVQSFYAAESGLQWGMGQLYFPVQLRVDTDDACLNMNETLNFGVTGLNNCNATVQCSCRNNNSNDPSDCNEQTGAFRSTYVITSIGSCGTGEVTATRTIEASAFLEDSI